jgi:hypothetical protein
LLSLCVRDFEGKLAAFLDLRRKNSDGEQRTKKREERKLSVGLLV